MEILAKYCILNANVQNFAYKADKLKLKTFLRVGKKGNEVSVSPTISNNSVTDGGKAKSK